MLVASIFGWLETGEISAFHGNTAGNLTSRRHGGAMGVVHRFTGKEGQFEWDGVAAETYEGEGAVGGTKRVVIGRRDGAENFGLRYFELRPGGRTSFDRHDHDHGVYVVRGKARAMMGGRVAEIGVGDVVYIPPNETHQFENIGDESFGFLCASPPRD